MKYPSQLNHSTHICLYLLLYLAGYISSLKLGAAMQPELLSSHWNWLGKLCAILFSCVFIALCPLLTMNNCRIKTNPICRIDALTLLIIIMTVALSYWINLITEDALIPSTWESRFYLALLPGIDEELAFRGIVMGLLLQAFSKNRVVLSIFISAILFGLVHILDLGFSLTLFYPIIFGIIFGVIAIRSQSLVLPIITHALVDSVPVSVSSLIGTG